MNANAGSNGAVHSFDEDSWRAHFDGADPAAHETPYPVLFGPEIAAPLPPLVQLVKGLQLPAGSGAPHLLAGTGYSGKTLAAQALALAVASGSCVWGLHLCEPGKVLHVDEEQGDRLTRQRYQRLAASMGLDLPELGDAIGLVSLVGLRLSPDRRPEWRALMEGRSLLIVDSLRVVTGGIDEKDSGIRYALDMLGSLSEETECRALVLHHARKPPAAHPGQEEDAAASIRGSSAIFDACDSVYVFQSARGEPVKVTQVKARSSGAPVEDFALVIADESIEGVEKAGLSVRVHGVELVHERREAAREAASAARAAITAKKDVTELCEALAALPDGAGWSTNQIRSELRINSARIRRAVALAEGRIVVTLEKTGRTMSSVHRLVR